MQRPTGITILAVLAAIGGVLGLLGSIALMGFGAVVGAAGLGGLAFIGGLIGLVYSVLSLIIAYGFWNLKPWAWTLGVAVQGLGIVYNVLQFSQGTTSNVVSLVIGVGIAAFIIWYLFQPHVKAAFGRS